MSNKPKYDPNALYYALVKIRRTAACVTGVPNKTAGDVYIEPHKDFDDKGKPINPTTFTMTDRTPEQVERFVVGKAIAPMPTS